MHAAATDIDGVLLWKLTSHPDTRGDVTEYFRGEWDSAAKPVQWNFVRTRANVLRGVHVHAHHFDYLIALSGTMFVGLHDLRPASASYGRAMTVELDDGQPAALEIPPGVCHGFYFPKPALHIYGVSRYWNPKDEMGCRWDDPALRIGWPCTDPVLSARDRGLGALARLEADLRLALADGVCASA